MPTLTPVFATDFDGMVAIRMRHIELDLDYRGFRPHGVLA